MAQVYEVAIHLKAENGVSGVLAAISKEVLDLGASVATLQKGLAGLKPAIWGALSIGAGLGLASELKGIANHGDKLLDQQDKLQRSGIKYNEVLRLQSKYYSEVATAVPTSTVSDYLRNYNELRSVVGAQHAEEITPWSMKLEAIIANATGKKAEGEGMKMWRAMEMTGRTTSDPVGTKALAERLAQNIIGSGGKLDAGTYQTMAKRGGVAWANASPDFLAGPMSVVAADLGGDTAGTAMMSAYMFMTGANTLSKQQYELLNKAKLIDPSKVTHDKGGRINVAPGGIVGSSDYTGQGKFDIHGWMTKVVTPALTALTTKEKGMLGDLIRSVGDKKIDVSHMNPEERSEFDSNIAKVGRNRNVMRMLTMFSDPGFLDQIAKDIPQWRQAHSIDQSYNDYTNRNSKGVKKAYEEQHESMMQSIGAPMMQAAIPVMKGITEMFTSIGGFANANPGAMANIGIAIAALSAALLVIGGTAVISAAVGAAGAVGLVAGAITALAVALALIKPPNKEGDRSPHFGLNGPKMPEAEKYSIGDGRAAFRFGMNGVPGNMPAPPYSIGQGPTSGWPLQFWGVPSGEIDDRMKAMDDLTKRWGVRPSAPTKGPLAAPQKSTPSAPQGESKSVGDTAGLAAKGAEAAQQIASGFNVAGFATNGESAGQKTIGGFAGADFAGAGTKAGASLLSGIMGSLGGVKTPGLGKMPQSSLPKMPDVNSADLSGAASKVGKYIGDAIGKSLSSGIAPFPKPIGGPQELAPTKDNTAKGAEAATQLANGFSLAGFATKGTDAGLKITNGFAGADFAGAGSRAGASLLSGIQGALSGFKMPSLGTTPNAPAAAKPPGKQSSFVPPSGATTGQKKMVFTVNGRVFASAMESEMVGRHEHTQSTNDHDVRTAFAPIDA